MITLLVLLKKSWRDKFNDTKKFTNGDRNVPHELPKDGGTNLHLDGSCGPLHRWWPSLVLFDLSRWDLFEGNDGAIIETLMCLRDPFSLSLSLSFSSCFTNYEERKKKIQRKKERKKPRRHTKTLMMTLSVP